MWRLRLFLIVFTALIAATFLIPNAEAGAWDQETQFTFNQPVELPGQTLAPGTYWFILASGNTNRHIVMVYSADWKHCYGTFLAAAAERSQSTSRTEIRFAERPHRQIDALLTWFYPGELIGHQFVYSSKTEEALARDPRQDLLAGPNSSVAKAITQTGTNSGL